MENANPLSRLILAALVLGLAACRERPPEAPAAPKTVADHFDMGVGGRTVHVQLAVLPVELERGLMGRRDLGPDDGMIFVFAEPQRLSFWMHDTPTPLDVGFFTPYGELAEVYPMFPYDERSVSSRGSGLRFALEVNQGWFASRQVRPGARLDTRALAAALRARGFDPGKFGVRE